MSTILDLEAWLAQADLWDHREARALHDAVQGARTVGIFECVAQQDATRWLVKAPHTEDTLILSTSAHRQALLGMLRQRYDIAAAPATRLMHWRLPTRVSVLRPEANAETLKQHA